MNGSSPSPLDHDDDIDGNDDDQNNNNDDDNGPSIITSTVRTIPPKVLTQPPMTLGEKIDRLLDRVDEFLDTPFFDPNQYYNDDDDDDDDNYNANRRRSNDGKMDDHSSRLSSESSPLTKFAKLVKQDYELAETLFVGSFFVVLIIITQELLRMQIHGDSYVPFMAGGGAGSGKLF